MYIRRTTFLTGLVSKPAGLSLLTRDKFRSRGASEIVLRRVKNRNITFTIPENNKGLLVSYSTSERVP